MKLNITHTMNNSQFESRENLKNTAKNILNRQNATSESSQKVIEQTIFQQKESYQSPQLSILKASSQITLNESLKETLKYLKSQANKKVIKEHVFGELWENVKKEDFSYNGELADLIIDLSSKNIFAAA